MSHDGKEIQDLFARAAIEVRAEDRFTEIVSRAEEPDAEQQFDQPASVGSHSGSGPPLKRWLMTIAIAVPTVAFAAFLLVGQLSSGDGPQISVGNQEVDPVPITTIPAAPQDVPTESTTVPAQEEAQEFGRPIEFETRELSGSVESLVLMFDGERYPMPTDALITSSSDKWGSDADLAFAWEQDGESIGATLFLTSSETQWWAHTILTYGPELKSDQLERARTDRDESFNGDLIADGLEIEGLSLVFFPTRQECGSDANELVLLPSHEEITFSYSAGSGFGINLLVLDPQTCTPIPFSELELVATSTNTNVAVVNQNSSPLPNGSFSFDLSGRGRGTTTLNITVTERATGRNDSVALQAEVN